MQAIRLLISPEDFEISNSNQDLACSGAVLFFTLWIVQYITYIFLRVFFMSTLKNATNCRKIARSLNEAASMMIMSFLGYQSFISQKGFSPFGDKNNSLVCVVVIWNSSLDNFFSIAV